MKNNPDIAAESLLNLSAIFSEALGETKWSIMIEEGAMSPIAIGLRDLENVPDFIMELGRLHDALPSSAYPVTISRTGSLRDIRLSGINVMDAELTDVIADLEIVEKSLPSARTDDIETFVIGEVGKLTPHSAVQIIFARSPIEAVMKFIITRVPISEMNAMPLNHPDIDHGDYEMRSQKDWCSIPFSDAFFFACKYLTATLVTRKLTDRVSV